MKLIVRLTFHILVFVTLAIGIYGCAPRIPWEGAVLRDESHDARQPAHVTASDDSSYDSGWFWVEDPGDRIMNGRHKPAGVLWPEEWLTDPGSRNNLMLIPATRGATTQELFLTWKEIRTLQGQFLQHDSSRLVGPQVTINPPDYPVLRGPDRIRRYSVASVPGHDSVLAAWIGHEPLCWGFSCDSASPFGFVNWRLVGRGDDPAAEYGTTHAHMGAVRTMFWSPDARGDLPAGIAATPACRAPAWGDRHLAVDVAPGPYTSERDNAYFLMVWVAEESLDVAHTRRRVLASKVGLDGYREWDFPARPGEVTLRDCPAERFRDVVVADYDGFYGAAVAAAYDSNRDRYLIVFTRQVPESPTTYELVGRFLKSDGSDDGPLRTDPIWPETVARGETLLMVAYNQRWERYAVAFTTTDTTVGDTLRVVELDPSNGTRYRSSIVPLDGAFVYGDLKTYNSRWRGRTRGCFSMALEDQGRVMVPGVDPASKFRWMWWCSDPR